MRKAITICSGGISKVDVKKEEAGLEDEMKKNQDTEEGKAMFLKPWEGGGSEHANAASFVSCRRKF